MSEWHITGWNFAHPVHGTFHITRLNPVGMFSMQRSWRLRQDGPVECEFVGLYASYRTLDEAKAAAEARIADLDAELARKASATPLCCSAPADATCSVREGL